MRVFGPDLILATTDLTKYVRCGSATAIELETKRGTLTPLARRPPSPMTDLIATKGDEHEKAYLAKLRAEGKTVLEIQRAPWSIEALRCGEAATLAAMLEGPDSIYQAAFFDGRWSGYADFLQRVELPSPILGGWSYEVVDTKLARSVKAHFLLQLSDYSHHLARLQGVAPMEMHVMLGTGERVSFRVSEFDAYCRHVRASLDRFVVKPDGATPYPVEFCGLCDWSGHCWIHWNNIDHLSLVANIRRTQVTRLERGDVKTLTALAEAPPQLQIRKVPPATFGALRHQASLQLEQRRTGEHRYELLPIAPKLGFNRLPRPADGDVFFDVEGDPFAGEGLTYLFGVAWEENGEPHYRDWWAHDDAAERDAFASVVQFLGERCADRAAHVYHYGAMEVATLKQLAGRHGIRENELDELLRREVFVDLSAVVRQGMRISHSSYGLKSVETFYGFERKATGVLNAGGAVVTYEQWLETGADALLAEIREYNREDCVSTMGLRRWLAGIRPAEATWKEPQEAQPRSPDRIEEDQKKDALFQMLTAHGLTLLGHLLYYHRREERPAWWWFFERKKMETAEWIDDSECIGGLTRAEEIPPVIEKQSLVYAYRYPSQEHKFDPGDKPLDPATGEPAGEVFAVNDAAGTIQLKRGPSHEKKGHPAALMPDGPINTTVVRGALQRFATSVAKAGLHGTPYRAAAGMLTAGAPRLTDDRPLDGMLETARRLNESYLFVQGPPGSGKTFHGAETIVSLLQSGKRVGVMASSHSAIHNLLQAIEEAARARNYWFVGVKKCGKESRTRYRSNLPNPMIQSEEKTKECANRALPLVAGTAWFFADDAMDQSLDYLFIDEAGQVSLANALAAATSARNVVLLGDPLQLAQVSQGTHPAGAGVSVLEHLLGKHATVPPDSGIFLEESWRMHPDVCTFVSDVVYESRLRSAAVCRNQAVTIDGTVETGLRFIAVEHEGNSQASDEEAQRIATEITRMLRTGSFTNTQGVRAPLAPSDFLVVAAYNAQVRHITTALANAGLTNVPVGTVDKFQGRQAPIVFFSLATSSGTDLPRDLEFLFSRNRLNVAISRARCLAILVASPRLLDVECKTPEQMRLVNGVCRFVEMVG